MSPNGTLGQGHIAVRRQNNDNVLYHSLLRLAKGREVSAVNFQKRRFTLSRRLAASRVILPKSRPGIAPNQLRHTYASEMVCAGGGLPALMKLLGHVNPEMTIRYVDVVGFATGISSGPIATSASRTATESPQLLAAHRSGRCRRFAPVRSTCDRDGPSFAGERRSEASPRSTKQSTHQNPCETRKLNPTE
jgi:hypothetical protein